MTEEDYSNRIKTLMPELIRTGKANSHAQVKELFTLHNERLLPRENGISCGTCRDRVFKRMVKYYNENYV